MTYAELLSELGKLKAKANKDATAATARIEVAKSRAVRYSSERDSQHVLTARQLKDIEDDVKRTMSARGYDET